jgi:integrase
MLLAYAKERVPNTRSAASAAYHISSLDDWWGDKRLADVTPANCQAYAAGRRAYGARRDLEVLRAAINYWHKHHGPLPSVPSVILPDKAPPRERWLTREEAAQLLWAARRTPHLARFILLGLYTGSRSGVILGLKWNQVDLGKGLLRRTAVGATDAKNKRAPVVRLGKRILTHLRRWKRLDDGGVGYLCHYNGARVQKMRRSWRAARERAGLDKAVTPHSLRHTRATWLMQAGIDVWEAAGHLGMTPETLQNVYGKHHPDYQKRAAEV